jgi:hypothetical protein
VILHHQFDSFVVLLNDGNQGFCVCMVKMQNRKSTRRPAIAAHRGETRNLMVIMTMMVAVAMNSPPSLATRQRHRKRRMSISLDVQ